MPCRRIPRIVATKASSIIGKPQNNNSQLASTGTGTGTGIAQLQHIFRPEIASHLQISKAFWIVNCSLNPRQYRRTSHFEAKCHIDIRRGGPVFDVPILTMSNPRADDRLLPDCKGRSCFPSLKPTSDRLNRCPNAKVSRKSNVARL